MPTYRQSSQGSIRKLLLLTLLAIQPSFGAEITEQVFSRQVANEIERWNADKTHSPIKGIRFTHPGEEDFSILVKNGIAMGGTSLRDKTGTQIIIVLNGQMRPPERVGAFYHEIGHLVYDENAIESECMAISTSLRLFEQSGFPDYAKLEAEKMARETQEPYRSAVERLQRRKDRWWIKYGPRTNSDEHR